MDSEYPARAHMSKTTQIQPEKPSQSVLRGVGLKSNLEAIRALYGLTSSCRGPDGQIKLLQSQLGGNLTITSSSKRLLSSLSVRNPIIQLLVSVTQGHLAAYGDGGLFLTNLASLLIIKSLESGLEGRLLTEIFDSFLSLSVSYLQSDECLRKVKVPFSNLKFIKCVIKSVLQTKPLCGWNPSKIRHIGQLILECFISNVFDSSYSSCSNHVFIINVENVPIDNSQVFPGLLLPAPELSKFTIQQLDLIRDEYDKGNRFRVVLVTMSMSGDMEELEGRKFEMCDGMDVETQILEELSQFSDHLVSQRVGLVLCQKVVHPELKYRLHAAQVVVVDRIGFQPIKYLQTLTGADPVTCLRVPVAETHYGWVDGVQHCIQHQRSYLKLSRADNSVSTLLLCQEQGLNELKEVCSVAMETLDQLVQVPYVLMGGGCWQTDLAQYISLKVKSAMTELCDELECSRSSLLKASEIFTSALLHSVLRRPSDGVISLTSGHLHTTSRGANFGEPCTAQNVGKHCLCELTESGQEDMFLPVILDAKKWMSVTSAEMSATVEVLTVLETRDIILDSFCMCANALQSAVLAASSVLKIGQVLENVV